MRQSAVTVTENRKSVNLEAERTRLLKEKDEVIKRFEDTYIYGPDHSFRNGVREKSYVDGSLYIGAIHNDRRYGTGIYHYRNGDKYAGEWKDDKFHGRGLYAFCNGERYDGELREGSKSGRGIYYYINGNRYEGDWKDDKKEGTGVYTYYASGEKYQGEWKNGEKNGKGTYTFADGKKYVGEWRNGEKNDQGSLSCYDDARTQPKARIVLMGKTGQGKSTLGNQIMGVEKFKVGKTMISETSDILELEFAWPEDKEIQVLLVDTPGLADNRRVKELSNDQIMKNIEEYMRNLGKGLNVGLFCWEAKARFSADDLNELALIQDLLGKGVIQHLWICITQLDKFVDHEAQKVKANALTDLPKILKENEFEFNETHLLFPQNINFKESIMKPLHEILKTTKAYKPPVVEDSTTVYLQFMTKELEQEAQAMTKKLEEVQNQVQKNIIVRQLSETEKALERFKQLAYIK